MAFRFDALKFAGFVLFCLLLQQQSLSVCKAQDSQGTRIPTPVARELKIPTEPPNKRVRPPQMPRTAPNILLIMPSEEARNSKAKAKSATSQPDSNSQDGGAHSPSQSKSATTTQSGVTNYGPGASRSTQATAKKVAASKTPETGDGDEDEGEDLISSIRSMGGDIIDTIGQGELTVWVVKFDTTERFLKAEKQLTNDSRVKNLQRDYLYKTNIVDSELAALVPSDPYYSSQWYFDALNVLRAWKLSKGGPNVIGVIDSGTNSQIDDLKQKCLTGYDAIVEKKGQEDVQGHGTMVATTAAATANNGIGTAGPATLSSIYPVRVGYPTGLVSISAIIKGIEICGNSGVKIINISSNGDPPYTFANRVVNGVLHRYLIWYHDEKGGLVFNSAGNSGTQDKSPLLRYLIVVSAIDESYTLAPFSTRGFPLWFTAPGTNIVCTEKDGHVVSVDGTSFSSPLVASIAALVWGANPKLTNVEVEKILIHTRLRAGRRPWTQAYGYGMPDAERAMQMALGQTKK